MSYNSRIKVLFACRLCADCFDQVSHFIAHKKENHFQEFQRTSCIVFEDTPFPKSSYHGYVEVEGSLPSSVSIKLDTFDDATSKLETEPEPEPQSEGWITTHPIFEVIPTKIETTDEETTFEQEIQPQEYKNPVVLLKRISSKKIQNFSENHSYKESNVSRMMEQALALPEQSRTCRTDNALNADRETCTTCSKRFKCSRKLRRHVAYMHGQTQFKCVVCKKSFATAQTLKMHGILHQTVSAFNCSKCDFTTKYKQSLKNHQKAVHDQIKDYVCGINNCNKGFSKLNNMNVHRNVVHLKEKKFICTEKECRSVFFSNADLKKHMVKHTQVLKYGCDKCGFRCRARAEVKRHKKYHVGCAQPIGANNQIGAGTSEI